LQKSSMV